MNRQVKRQSGIHTAQENKKVGVHTRQEDRQVRIHTRQKNRLEYIVNKKIGRPERELDGQAEKLTEQTDMHAGQKSIYTAQTDI